MTVSAWAAYADLPAPLPTLPGGEAEWDTLLLLSSEVLYALSGRRWTGGTVTRTVELVAPAVGESPHAAPPGPYLSGGEVYNRGCSPAPAEVRLPHSDAVSVQSVTINGVARDPASYRLSGRYLQDLSGRGWPTSPPGMIIVYSSGRLPPAGGVRAAAVLARELGRDAAGDPACALPANVKSTTRQGITTVQETASEIIKTGRTGLVAVDQWLVTVNPDSLRRAARAWSPDTAPRAYTYPSS